MDSRRLRLELTDAGHKLVANAHWYQRIVFEYVTRDWTEAEQNERTGTPFNYLEFPTGIVLLTVVWRLRLQSIFINRESVWPSFLRTRFDTEDHSHSLGRGLLVLGTPKMKYRIPIRSFVMVL